MTPEILEQWRDYVESAFGDFAAYKTASMPVLLGDIIGLTIKYTIELPAIYLNPPRWRKVQILDWIKEDPAFFAVGSRVWTIDTKTGRYLRHLRTLHPEWPAARLLRWDIERHPQGRTDQWERERAPLGRLIKGIVALTADGASVALPSRAVAYRLDRDVWSEPPFREIRAAVELGHDVVSLITSDPIVKSGSTQWIRLTRLARSRARADRLTVQGTSGRAVAEFIRRSQFKMLTGKGNSS